MVHRVLKGFREFRDLKANPVLPVMMARMAQMVTMVVMAWTVLPGRWVLRVRPVRLALRDLKAKQELLALLV
jgi:hypothetical protein